ncbi:hypothetical protein [Niastella koreensis]|nr:hypothetical protein [Niastella koreensis]
MANEQYPYTGFTSLAKQALPVTSYRLHGPYYRFAVYALPPETWNL